MIYIDDVEKRNVEKIRFDDVKEHALTRCIKVGTNQEIRETMDELFQGIEGGCFRKGLPDLFARNFDLYSESGQGLKPECR